jgi:DNA-binding GntR family transcriptional regulator
MTTGAPHDTNVTHDQHAAILDAMLKGDKDMAESLMREHIRTGRVEMEASWAAEREDIHWMENIPAELKN